MANVDKTESEWREELTPEQYHVLREAGTEPPYSGEYVTKQDNGSYSCAACGNVLFSSDTQYESTLPGLLGWPSFADVASSDAVELRPDKSLFASRTEVICKNCGSHLGHLFDDHTSPTNQHYCINSLSLNFNPKEEK